MRTPCRIVAIVLILVADHAAQGAESRFVALSLRQAAQIAQSGTTSGQLDSLCGITRVVGVIYDPAGDVVLVGLTDPTLPAAEFSYLVTALQSRFQLDEFPLVSIDPVADTQRTRQQHVRFVGPLEDSPYGRDLLACDVRLKQYSLSLIKTIAAVPAYNVLLEEDVRAAAAKDGVTIHRIDWKPAAEGAALAGRHRGAPVDSSTSYQARFWFYVRMPPRTDFHPDNVHPEIFIIRELQLCLLSDPVHSQNAGQYARKQFSLKFTQNLDEVAEAHPALKRLKILYDLMAAADAIRALDRNVADLAFVDQLLQSYRVPHTPTPRHYKLEETFGSVARSDQRKQIIRISGGIEFARDEIADSVENLGYGHWPALRTLVLQSRPAPAALTWQVPLQGWQMPNATDLKLPTQLDLDRIAWRAGEGGKAGFSLSSQSVVFAQNERGTGQSFNGFVEPTAIDPLNGVSMRIDVTEDSFRVAQDPRLRELEAWLKAARPSKDSLSWPAGDMLKRFRGSKP